MGSFGDACDNAMADCQMVVFDFIAGEYNRWRLLLRRRPGLTAHVGTAL